MAPHSSTLAWRIPWAEEPGGLQSMGSRRVRHAWATDFPFTFQFHALEKEMATHSSVLAWRIPGTGEPGGLPSMESHRVGHDWSDLAVAVALNDWRIALQQSLPRAVSWSYLCVESSLSKAHVPTHGKIKLCPFNENKNSIKSLMIIQWKWEIDLRA